MKKFNAKELTIEELIAINVEALENFKAGNETLMEERKKNTPDGSCDDLFVQEVAQKLIVEIIEASVDSVWEGIGLASTSAGAFHARHD